MWNVEIVVDELSELVSVVFRSQRGALTFER